MTSYGPARARLSIAAAPRRNTTITSCAGRAADAVEVRAEAIERWAREVAVEHGFTSITHTAEVFGFCNACGRAGP